MDYVAREIAGLRMSVGELATRDYVRSELRNELRAILAELESDESATLPPIAGRSQPATPDRLTGSAGEQSHLPGSLG